VCGKRAAGTGKGTPIPFPGPVPDCADPPSPVGASSTVFAGGGGRRFTGVRPRSAPPGWNVQAERAPHCSRRRRDASDSREAGGRGVWHALFHFLVLCDREPIPLTREGEDPPPLVEKAGGRIGRVGRGFCRDTPWADGRSRLRSGLVRDLARLQGLVRERGGCPGGGSRSPRFLAVARSWEERIPAAVRSDPVSPAGKPAGLGCLGAVDGSASQRRMGGGFHPVGGMGVAGRTERGADPEGRVGASLAEAALPVGWIELASSPRGMLWRWTSFAPAVCRAGGGGDRNGPARFRGADSTLFSAGPKRWQIGPFCRLCRRGSPSWCTGFTRIPWEGPGKGG
jgi:hypothetical protein